MDIENTVAINIALLLPKEVNDLCFEINSTSNTDEYVDFKNGYNPHITLSMGCINKDEVENLQEELEIFFKDQQQIDLKITGFDISKPSWLSIEKNVNIDTLHNKVHQIMQKYSKYTATKESFFETNEISDSLVEWVNTFDQKQAGDNYNPHISVGKGSNYNFTDLINFSSNTIGLFQIGKHGTAKNELKRFILK
jgi:hypothetical protein